MERKTICYNCYNFTKTYDDSGIYCCLECGGRKQNYQGRYVTRRRSILFGLSLLIFLFIAGFMIYAGFRLFY